MQLNWPPTHYYYNKKRQAKKKKKLSIYSIRYGTKCYLEINRRKKVWGELGK